MMEASRSDVRSLDVPERHWSVWQEAGVFTKNPDLVLFPSGKLLCVFNATDFHWPTEFARITVSESQNRGRTWGRPRVVDEALPGRGEEPWITPRLSLLRDSRLVIVCDQNDYRHQHEAQPSGIYAWWSDDEGESWDGPHPTGVPGIEPDRVRELADGTLLIGTHYMSAATQKMTQAVLRSTDGGKTWGDLSVVASDAVHNYCEGAVFPLESGRLVCVMREDQHTNYPSYLALSDDQGRSWTKATEAPFSGDRPFAGELADGRTLVTYRNQTGKPGLYGWLGDIEAEQGYKVSRAAVGGTHQPQAGSAVLKRDHPTPKSADGISLETDCLKMQNGPGTVTRYLLLPPESFTSEVRFECDIEVDGFPNVPAATIQIARIGLHLTVTPDRLGFERIFLGQHERSHPYSYRPLDMRRRRHVKVLHRGGLMEVFVDGGLWLSTLVDSEELWDRSFFGNGPDHDGTARWYNVEYEVNNPTDPPHSWRWDARSGQYPNQYEIYRWLEIDYNSTLNPDHGYSSWVQFPDGEVLVLDYTNEGAPVGKAMLKGYSLRVEDFGEIS